MLKSTLSLVVLVIATQVGADPVDEVRCREISFSLAAEERDAERFTASIDDDARFVGNTVTRGPAVIAEAWKPFFAADGPRIRWRPQFVEVLEDGTLALTRGPYRVISTDADGAAVERWGTFNSVWRRQDDGDWKVVFDAGSVAAAPPTEEVRQLLDQAHTCTF